MLDDRPTTPDPQLLPILTWTYDDNLTGWGALLGDDAGSDDVSPYAAPARATDLAGPARHLHRRRRPRHLPRRGHRLRAQAVRCRACRPNFICIPAARTPSKRWPTAPTCPSGRSTTASADCVPCDGPVTVPSSARYPMTGVMACAQCHVARARGMSSDVSGVELVTTSAFDVRTAARSQEDETRQGQWSTRWSSPRSASGPPGLARAWRRPNRGTGDRHRPAVLPRSVSNAG